MSYLILSAAFSCAWLLAAWRIDRQKFPAFKAWLWIRAAQAIGATLAGARPPEWYTSSVWAPVEALSLVVLDVSMRELIPRRRLSLCVIGGMLAAPMYFALHLRGSGWIVEFLKFRECFWIAAAVALIGNLVWLYLRPIEASKTARQTWWTTALYAAVMAISGWPMATTQREHEIVRAFYMVATFICCWSWSGLPTRWAEKSAAGNWGIRDLRWAPDLSGFAWAQMPVALALQPIARGLARFGRILPY